MQKSSVPGLRPARHRRKISVVQLAASVQCAERSIHSYERGEASPRADILKSLATTLGVTSDELLGITEAQ